MYYFDLEVERDNIISCAFLSILDLALGICFFVFDENRPEAIGMFGFNIILAVFFACLAVDYYRRYKKHKKLFRELFHEGK